MKNQNKTTLKLGVTGGIGSGKTTVCRIFQVLGIPVFSADEIAKEIIDNDPVIARRIDTLAGGNIMAGESLDRRKLASLVFNDKKLLEKINALVHPIVYDRFKPWIDEQDSDYVIMEAAILFESGASKRVDKVLTVIADEEEKIERVMLRSSLSRAEVISRMRNQIDDTARISKSDYVVNNSENEMIIPEILRIHRDLINQVRR